MSYYTNAESKARAAKALLQSDNYDSSVALSCLAVELYLKSRLDCLSEREQDKFEFTHDTIGLYYCLSKKFDGSPELFEAIKMCKKYFSESRYISNGTLDFYTEEVAENFMGYVEIVKDFVDTKCVTSLTELETKFKKQ